MVPVGHGGDRASHVQGRNARRVIALFTNRLGTRRLAVTGRGASFFDAAGGDGTLLLERTVANALGHANMADPPYGIICNRLKTGRVIPFLGAGASFGERPPGGKWDAARPIFLPSGVELAHFLADEAEFPSTDPADRGDLAKVSSYYADIAGRRALRERLREVLNHEYQGSLLHELLAAVPAPLVIVVTNYDSLVEKAFRAGKAPPLNGRQCAGKPYDLVVYPSDRKDIANAILWWPQGALEPLVKAPNELDIDLTKTTVIYKMHGTIIHEDEKWDNFVITEEDYVEFLSRMTASAAIPSQFDPHFRERSFFRYKDAARPGG